MRVHTGIALLLASAVATGACNGGSVFGTDRVPTTATGGTTGSIRGQVQANGSGLGGVTVLLGNSDSTVTNTAGTFTFDRVAAATYTVGVRVPAGFTLAAGETGQRAVVVAAGGTASANFVLQGSTQGSF